MQNLEKQRTESMSVFGHVYYQFIERQHTLSANICFRVVLGNDMLIQCSCYFFHCEGCYQTCEVYSFTFDFVLTKYVPDIRYIAYFYFNLALFAIGFHEELNSEFDCFPCGLIVKCKAELKTTPSRVLLHYRVLEAVDKCHVLAPKY